MHDLVFNCGAVQGRQAVLSPYVHEAPQLRICCESATDLQGGLCVLQCCAEVTCQVAHCRSLPILQICQPALNALHVQEHSKPHEQQCVLLWRLVC